MSNRRLFGHLDIFKDYMTPATHQVQTLCFRIDTTVLHVTQVSKITLDDSLGGNIFSVQFCLGVVFTLNSVMQSDRNSFSG